jgi:hypothetical protein
MFGSKPIPGPVLTGGRLVDIVADAQSHVRIHPRHAIVLTMTCIPLTTKITGTGTVPLATKIWIILQLINQ